MALAMLAVLATGCRSNGHTSLTGAAAGSEPDQTSAVTSAPASPTPVAPRTPRTAATTAVAMPNGDVLLDGGVVVLPNRTRTPGAANPAVTQATISRTICRTGYTRTIRPPSSYTTGLKRQQLATGYAYHGDVSTRDYEEDHLISLELGGSPTSTLNLWPEPYLARDGARVKDLVENRLHDLVCSGQLSLRTAQRAIVTNWWAAYLHYGGQSTPGAYDGTYAGTTTTSSGSSTSSTSTTSGATAQCRDGTYSYSQHRSGTCSRHGGVERWINPPPN